MFDDFPETATEFDARFATEEDCWEYLYRKRWPDGFLCPNCSGREGWQLTRGRLIECAACGRQTSVTAGTVLHRTKKPLQMWFKAIFLMSTLKTGVSAKALQRLLGMTYKVAWAWTHKLRAAMATRPKERLQGRVEIDEAYIGGHEELMHGRQHGEKKAIVVVAVEDLGDPSGRVRLEAVPDASGRSLVPAVETNVAPGTTVHTDRWLGYVPLRKRDYRHLAEVAGVKDAAQRFPHVHRTISLLKRFLLGTFQGSVSRKHLQSYLEEFEFRFNRRATRRATRIADALFERVVSTLPHPYFMIVQGRAPTARRAA